MYGVDVKNTPIEVPNSEELSPVGNDAVSSVKVGRGVRLEMFSDNGFRGDKLTLFEGNYPHLLDWNDRVTGLRVEKINPVRHPVAMFYVDNNIGDDDATCHGLSSGDYPDSSQLLKNDSYTVVVVPYGLDVTVFENGNFNGYSQTFNRKGTYFLRQYNLNDKLSSIRIINQKYLLTEVFFSNGNIIAANLQETLLVEGSIYNESDKVWAEQELSLETSKMASMASTKETSQMYGLTVTAGTSLDIEGLITVERNIALSTQQVFVNSETKSDQTSQAIGGKVTVKVPPKTRARARLVATPVTKQFDVTYRYKRVNENGQEIAGGEILEEKDTIILKYASQVYVIVEDISGDVPTFLDNYNIKKEEEKGNGPNATM